LHKKFEDCLDSFRRVSVARQQRDLRVGFDTVKADLGLNA
jgi:hypothetical protein